LKIDLIWTSKRPTPQDNEATEVFIQIVISDDVQNKLIDKKTPKIKVWQIVYQKMRENGYIVSNEIKDGGNKCFQKWRNLKKSYQNHKQRSFKTGNGFMKTPAHYDILHCFMESKHKINPPSIIDTLSINKKAINTSSSISTVASLSPINTSGLSTASATALFSDLSDDEEPACMTMPSTSKISPPSILHNPKNTLKPANKTSIILDTLNKQHIESMKLQKEQHAEFIKILDEQTKLRSQMLGFFETITKSLCKEKKKENIETAQTLIN